MNPNYYDNPIEHSANQKASQHQSGHRQQQSTTSTTMAMKRTFDQMQQQQNSITSIGSGNYHNSNSNMTNPYFNTHSSYAGSVSGGSMSSHPPDYDMFNQLNAHIDHLYGSNTNSHTEAKPMKKYKRGESSILFSPPFFKLLEGFTSPNHKDAIAARCYACGKVVRGNKSISSNFIKHMKRGHPEINKIYDSYKMYRIKTGVLPHISQIIAGCKMDVNNGKFERDDSSGIVGDSNDDENCSQYIEASVVLDSSELGDGENDAEAEAEDENNKNYENSDNDDDFTNPQPTEANEGGNSDNININISERDSTTNHLTEVINKIVEEKLKDFVRQSDVETFQKSSSDTTAFNQLKKEVDNLKKECSALRLAVQQSQASKRQLQNELESVDKLLHQRKLIIRNLKLKDDQKPQKSIEIFLCKKLGLEDIKIINCTIIPPTKPFSVDSKKKCLLIELQNPLDAKNILRQIPKLKDTGIFIEPEISPLQRKRKDKLMIVRKELLRRKPDLKVMVRNTTLVVEGQQFYWDDVEGLCHDANREALELNAIEYLKKLTTLDLKEFIDILQNYDVQVR
ncbi:uncharacterized protein [Musca autumnalis]|uniref:uncharacterized protein n=1 Tax=Musca autumnalis TaxID=221902 RepID=UPI003CEB232D